MYKVTIQNISKSFGTTRVLDNIDLEIGQGELFFLLGPSGCGKTTLLRILAGFEQPDSGTVQFNGRDATGLVPQKRNTSMVFQSYALWPHMTVFENVAYGLENRKISGKEIDQVVTDVLGLVRMDEYRNRMPNQLSGGQQQRIALARALAVSPELLLLDEPLSNLDARLRAEMRVELLRLHRQTGVTTVYVTHDQEEALSLADRIAFIDNGNLVQVGTPRELYSRPTNTRTARFLGNANLVEGTVIRQEAGLCVVETPLGTLAGRTRETEPVKKGRHVFCFFRPEQMTVQKTDGNQIRGTVLSRMYGGGFEHLMLAHNHTAFQALIPAPPQPSSVGTEYRFGIAEDLVWILTQ